jgi:DNA-binding MarR family transcriptional regulator
MPADSLQSADKMLQVRAENWPEAATPISQLMVRVYRLASLVRDNATEQVDRYGLTLFEFEVLVALRGVAPPYELVPTDLYTAVLISSGGLTKVLHGLQRRGLISRGKNKLDRRSKPIRLTAKGRDTVEWAMEDVLRSDAQLISKGLSEGELADLTRLLRKLLGTIEPGGNNAGTEDDRGYPAGRPFAK